MKRKDAARTEGTCPRDAPKDEKCANCRSKKGACLVAARIAAGNALPSPDEPSTSKPRTTQPAADSDMDDAEPRPSRERKAPERIEVDDLRSRATACLPFLIGKVCQTPLLAFGDSLFKSKR